MRRGNPIPAIGVLKRIVVLAILATIPLLAVKSWGQPAAAPAEAEDFFTIVVLPDIQGSNTVDSG